MLGRTNSGTDRADDSRRNIGRLIRKIEYPLLLRHLDPIAAAHETRLGRGKRQRARM